MPLKPWYNVVVPREDLREGKPMDASEFAVHLDHVRAGSAPIDYKDPVRFFKRTYLTQNLIDLAAQTIRRLSGITTETSPVFNLSTQFGGGKTHALTVLYHLANGGNKAKEWEGVSRILDKAGIKDIKTAKIGVFVGTEFSSVSGRDSQGHPNRKTPWGEMAFQIGGADAYEKIRKHDENFIAPAGDNLAEIFDKDQPYLLLFDELLNYISKHRNYKDLAGQFYNFLQTLTEFVRSRNNIVLAVSIPASEMEMTAEDQADFDRCKKMLDRLGKAIFMSAERESSEIIRRRLFDWNGLPKEAEKTITEYTEWLKTHEAHIPSWFNLDKAKETFEASYPFHPNVLSLFERKWQSLPRFQQTRGILRLLALWVSKAYSEGYKKDNKDALLSLGTAPLEDPIFRAAVFEQMGENRLEVAVTTDIAGKNDSHAVRFDQDSTGAIQKLALHKKCGVTIFFESNGGQTADKLCTLPEIKLNLCDPELDIGLIDTVLQDLVDGCYYLTTAGAKYKFSTQENLIKRFSDKKATINDKDIKELMEQSVSDVFVEGAKTEYVLFPTLTNQVADRTSLMVFVLNPMMSFRDKDIMTFIRDVFNSNGTNPRVYRNGLIGIAAENTQNLKDEVRKYLAWVAINKEAEELHFEREVVQHIKENVNRGKKDIKEQVWRAYRYMFLLGKNGEVNHIDLGLLHSSQSSYGIMEVFMNRLITDGEVSEEINPNFLVRNWPPSIKVWPTQQIRDVFYNSPAFPRIKSGESLKSTIIKGVANGIFGYCQLKAGNVMKVTIGKTLPIVDVEISNDVALLQADQAKKYEEPRKLAKITIQAQKAVILPGEAISIKALGQDQFDDAFELGETKWECSYGKLSETGIFTGPTTDCEILVHAKVGTLTGSTTISVKSSATTSGASDSNRKTKIRWSAEVPPGKWMVFYNKVLAKFTGKKDFKVNVSFEFFVNGDGKDDVSNLKTESSELGLNSDIKTE
jgi:hypothetical protein